MEPSMFDKDGGGASFALAAAVGEKADLPRKVCARVAQIFAGQLNGRHYGAVDLFAVTVWFECEEVPLDESERGVFGVELGRSENTMSFQIALTRSEWEGLPAAALVSILTERIRRGFQALAEYLSNEGLELDAKRLLVDVDDACTALLSESFDG